MYRLLIVDDEITMLKGITFYLQENKDYELLTASDKRTAIQLLETNEIDLVVSDLMMPKVQDGLEVIKSAKKQWYQPSILAMTAFETVENAVNTMKAGADDFVSKGFGIDELMLRIDNLLTKKMQMHQLAVENLILKETIQHHYSGFQIIGKSVQMEDLMNKVRKVAADAKATCLIEGESGTGKDLVARTIHSLSKRRSAPFVPINCAAIPVNLIESELFGHEKGSFTGAYSTRQGKFEHANGGIVFLDEISELPLQLQNSLLRVLEERNFYRIGGKRAIEVDVMVLAASNKDPLKQISLGRFREDLYYRLNVINIYIPPLRERREDIQSLAHFFINKFNQERKKNIKLTKSAIRILEEYDYPGNVRELRNILEDAFVFCNTQWIRPENLYIKSIDNHSKNIRNEHIEKILPRGIENLAHKKALEIFEKEYFLKLMQLHSWNAKKAAHHAKLTREWLSKKIKALGLQKCEE